MLRGPGRRRPSLAARQERDARSRICSPGTALRPALIGGFPRGNPRATPDARSGQGALVRAKRVEPRLDVSPSTLGDCGSSDLEEPLRCGDGCHRYRSVLVTKRTTIRYGPHRSNVGDLWLPAEGVSRVPVIVLIMVASGAPFTPRDS